MSDTRRLTLTAPISVGELFDKITILRIKSSRIEDPIKLSNVLHELSVLEEVAAQFQGHDNLHDEVQALLGVNQTLWDIEDDIRACERGKAFGEQFIQLARSVYIHNDQRARIKRRINNLCGSSLLEEKNYASY